jgi:hypothetical protein
VSDAQFRTRDEPVPTMALTSNPEDGRAAAIEQMGYLLPAEYHRVPTWMALVDIGVGVVWLIGMALVVLFALIWIPRKLLRRLKHIRRIGPRVWPLVATLTVGVFCAIFVITSEDVLASLGAPTRWSWALFLSTILFPIAAVAGYFSARRAKPADAGRFARKLGLVVSTLNVVVAAYLAWWGIIGWRSWT